jgi:hypothetical protein
MFCNFETKKLFLYDDENYIKIIEHNNNIHEPFHI